MQTNKENSAHQINLLSSDDALEAGKRVAQDARESEFHFLQIKALVSQSKEELSEAELDASKEHLSKLKFNFIELETKNTFLQHVSRNSPFPLPDAIQQLEGSVSGAKSKYKALKEENGSLKSRILAIGQSIEQEYTVFEAKVAELSGLIHEIETLKSELESLQASQPKPLRIGSEVISNENIQAFVDEQSDLLAKLSHERSAAERHLQELEAAKRSLLDSQSDLDTTKNEIELGNSFEQAQLVEMNEWFHSMSCILARLAGIEIVDRQALSLTVNVALKDQTSASVFLQFAPSSVPRLRAAQVVSHAASVDDIVRHAVATNNVVFLLQEIKQRLNEQL